MKSHKRLPLILALCFASATLSAQTADEDVTLGRAALAAHNLAGAYADFSSAVTLSPTNETANALLAVTRLLVLPQQPAGSNFLTSLGFAAAGRNLYDWTATLPKGANGKTLLPSENSSVAIAFYRSTVIPALGASWTNLARIADPGFTLTLTAAETSQEAVTVDYGDLLLMQAELEAGEFLGYTLNAQNFDFVASQLQSLSTADDLTIQEVLATYPSLLKPNSAADLANSKTALTSAIASYQAASAFIRNQRQPGQGLFVLNEDELDKEAKFRTDLTNILLSLNGPVPISPKASFSLDLGNYFAGTTSVRSLVPQFSGDNYRHNSLPDYTFGGILVGEPAYATESLLRQKFDKHDYSGIYAGQVSDNYVNDSQSGNSFAVFVSTNQQATVIGFDPGEGIAFYAQGSLDKGGNVEFTNSLFSGYGSFGGGQCYLELDFTNGLSVYPYGGLESPLGPYQSGAGAYSGTYSGVASGTLKAIFAADGELFFAPLTSGRANDGGLAEMEAGDTFYGISVGQTEVMGSYSPHTLSFTGTYLTGYESGGVSSTQIFLSLPNPAPRAANAANGPANSLALTRSDSVPFDVPPVFSAPPVNQTAGTGSNAVFSVTATGSAPLCYQWFANGVPINGATAASLVVSNVSPALSGNQYSVTAENVVGAASAAATLTVLRTSVKPVVTNLNLTAGQQVGAGLFTVTGNAGDVSGVAGVWYQLNNGAWTLASTTNHWTNWSATLSLTPGPNTLRTYAEDINSDGFLYVADNNNNLIRKITAAGVVTTLAGDTDDLTNGNNNAGYADGLGTNAWFNSPKSTAVDAAGDIYVSDSGNNLIRRLTPAGVVTTLAGDTYALTNGGYNRANNAGYADGLAAAAQFNSPAGLAVDGAGNLFVADSYNNLIRKITTAGVVTTLAGDIYDLTNGGYNGGSNAANAGYADGPGTNARFNYPTDVAVDDLGNVYVADAYNNLIRKITAAGVVTTLAGDIYDLTNGGYNGGSNGRYADGSGVGAAFHFPISTTLDRSGNLLVADCFNNLIRTITPAGVVTTLAGDISDLTNGNSNAGYADGPAAAAVFKSPIGTAVDGYDDVFVADYGNNLIRKLSPAGVVSTLAGDTFDVTNSVASTGYADGAGAAAQFDGPAGVAADGSGGNISPTNTVTFNYVVSAELTVLTNQPGWGVLSTNYNGVPLQIGKTYSVTATAKPGFAFTNWTGSLTTTNPILTFVMASNLTFTANFADTNRPTVAITSPAPNATETSSALTVTGTATDNVAVRSVWFQLNSNGWTQLTLNGGSNWTTQVTLTQPTNTLAVYAVDTSGNDSLTNRLSVAYVVSAELTVLTNQPGWGVLSTNYNGVPLQIGKTYSVTATAKPGFAFTNWTGSLTTTNPILTFVMASNLTFTANFADTNRPTVAITSPAPNATETSSALTVTGTAADNVAVRSVWFQLNSNGWTQLTLNGGSNWTTQVTLTQPTNTLAVYAVDTSGNDSLTNRLSVAYVVSAELTVLTNQPGWGVLSTNYNGVPLQIGKTYSVTATAKPGFAFTNWTGSLTTTNPILTFVMASNLTFTANFADTNRPTVAITSPAPNATETSSALTVTGTAADNVAVRSVWFQLNSNGWTQLTLNGGSNWTTQVTLTQPTNTLAVYAVDTSGNDSLTNRVSVAYVVSAALTVLTNQPGWGVLSTNYNGVPLQIGKTYSVTATAKPGFAFTNWTGSLTTTNPILTFVMASNLTFTANFVDTNRPTVAITSPVPNATETSAALTVTGTAADNVAVRSVWFQLNSNGWTQLTLNGGSNWTTQVTLTQPTNTLAVYAVDTSGNDSLTNRVSVAYVVSAALTVLTNQPGWGVLSTNYNGVPLQIGKTYSVTATAKPGFAFTNWTGSLTTTNPILTFVMASNLTFTANFVDTNRPTVAITSPVPNATETSAALTVTGTAADNVAVRSVWFQLNSNGWTQLTLNGGSNWTTQVTLTQPTNTLAVYAVDTSGNDSLTNRLSVAYVVSAALTVLTNQPGWGVLSTNYNGVPLQIGKTYSVTATAKPGFAFTDWTGSLTTTNPILTFVMASNLTFTANFADTNIPTLTITAPTPNLHVSNSVYTVTGTVTDNVIVAQVNYQLNEGGWLTASTANGFTNWFTTSLTLISGTNTIQAYAVDTLNHVSATNTVSFVNLKADPAPASLAGLVATVTPSGGSVITVGFGTDTYSQSATDTNDNYTVGTYAYTKLEANFARLVITPAAPFTNQSGGFSGYLTFNADGTGTFSNANNGDTGNISLAASSNLPPSSVAGKTALFISGGGVTTVVFGNGTLTKTGSSGQVQSYSYNYQSYSPVGALFTLVDTNLETNYLVAAFLATNHGLFYRSSYDADGALQGEAYGGFVFPSASPFAPASLNGYEARTTRSDESTATVAFDASTFSMTASDTNHDTDVGDYTYKTIGVTNAQLTLTVTAPPSATNYGGSVYLTFVANNFCLFTNQDNGSNSISGLGLKTVANLVPSSLSGTVYATNDLSGTVDVVTFNSNGTFSQTESNSDNSGTPSQGTFTFTPYSPIGAMLQLKYTSPAAMAGTKVYSQVTYSQPQAGTYHATSYDTKGDQPDISTGTFSVH